MNKIISKNLVTLGVGGLLMTALSCLPFKVGLTQIPTSSEPATSQGLNSPEKDTIRGDYQAAIKKLDEILQANNNEANAYLSRGSLYILTRNYEKAAEDLEKAARIFEKQGNTAMQQQALRQLKFIKESQIPQE